VFARGRFKRKPAFHTGLKSARALSGTHVAYFALGMDTKGKKVLIVDDSAVIVQALSMKLTSAGYKVITAEDGAGAVSCVRREKPDLILLDISFPPDVAHGGGVAWDGFLIMSWIKRLDEAKGVPVILITADESDALKKQALKAGATHFFHKPINNEEVLEVIKQALSPIALPPKIKVAAAA
jgi:two-component system chemotaxis response regulator CheY